MRSLTALTIAGLLTVACPAFAQSINGSYNPADAWMTASHHDGMMQSKSMRSSYGRRQHPLGSLHHPTVGHTANQRVNGG